MLNSQLYISFFSFLFPFPFPLLFPPYHPCFSDSFSINREDRKYCAEVMPNFAHIVIVEMVKIGEYP